MTVCGRCGGSGWVEVKCSTNTKTPRSTRVRCDQCRGTGRTLTDQSTLFGDDRPDDLSLGVTQRNVMRALRDLGPMGRAEIGAVIHATRGRHDIDEICPRCGIDAVPVIASLKDRGLVERASEGDIRPVEPARTVRNPSAPIQEAA